MKIRLLMMGKNKGGFINDGIEHFLKIINGMCELELVFIKNEKITDNGEQALEKEAKRIEKHLKKDEYLIVLDEEGNGFSTRELSEFISRLHDRGVGRFTFLIGSSTGISSRLKERANLLLSLSPLTMNHQIVRLVLMEQLYRVFTLQRGMKYHR